MWQMVVMLVLLTAYGVAQYHERIRHSPWLLWIALAYSVSTHLLWVSLVRTLRDKNEIFRVGFYWDTAMYLPIFLVPLVLFSVRPSLLSSAGLVLVVAGAILFHLGSR